jgi:hypothetical protein
MNLKETGVNVGRKVIIAQSLGSGTESLGSVSHGVG